MTTIPTEFDPTTDEHFQSLVKEVLGECGDKASLEFVFVHTQTGEKWIATLDDQDELVLDRLGWTQ